MKHQPSTIITSSQSDPFLNRHAGPEACGTRTALCAGTRRGLDATKSFRPTMALSLFCVVLIFAVQAFAHGGFDHVIGTVSKVENNVVTVKTAKGEVDVKLTDKTEISRGDQKAEIGELKPGTRVVIDVPEGSKDRVAHSVKVGGASAASHK